jgi:hypothetical protein
MRLSSSWLRHSTPSAPVPAARPRIRTSPCQRAGFCPRLEVLESRWLFSTLTVTSDQDSGAGSLRETIAAAQSGDTIVFSVTPTSGNSTITLTSGQLLITKDLTIQGPGAGQLVISGSPILSAGSRAFEVAEGSALTLSGLKISGSSDYWATYYDVTPTPWAGYGGGVLNHGTLAASGCTFTGGTLGTSAEGGAIFSDGTLTLSACTVAGGLAQGGSTRGGGISNWGTATLTNTIVSNNSASATTTYPWFNQGGGIYNQGTITLNGCTVSGNYAREMGGGILNYGTLILDGSTVSGNNTGNYGGGIYNAGTTTVQNSSSITGNSAPYVADVFNTHVVYQGNTSTIGVIGPSPAIDIVPDPNALQLRIGDMTVTEGNTGTTSATFTVTLSAASTQTVTVTYSTNALGTATAGHDYQAASGTLTFAPGEASKTIRVPVYGDRLGEPDETFNINLSGATNALIGDGRGVGRILDNEPRISINDVTLTEGRKGTTYFTFTVTLSAAYDQTVTTSFRTANGTATSHGDYSAKSGALTFMPGERTKTITVAVKGDRTRERDENFTVQLFGASSNASLLDELGIGTILNDD